MLTLESFNFSETKHPRGRSRISGKGVHIFKGVGVRFAGETVYTCRLVLAIACTGSYIL